MSFRVCERIIERPREVSARWRGAKRGRERERKSESESDSRKDRVSAVKQEHLLKFDHRQHRHHWHRGGDALSRAALSRYSLSRADISHARSCQAPSGKGKGRRHTAVQSADDAEASHAAVPKWQKQTPDTYMTHHHLFHVSALPLYSRNALLQEPIAQRAATRAHGAFTQAVPALQLTPR